MSVSTVWWTNYPTRQTAELPLDSLQKKTPIFTSENLVFSGDFPVTVRLESAQKMWGTVKTSQYPTHNPSLPINDCYLTCPVLPHS
ncbi:hypothetical protein BYT27DRAFT_7185396 [Phlegmacium glaucopus]|nr:hypothetical protein BYT27DRAFT_7185396 [Phlegmacium glaucopus]